MAPMDGARSGQPRRVLADGLRAGNYPAWRDFLKRIEREATLDQTGVGDGKRSARPAAAGPEQDIEVQHAHAPAATAPPSELTLDPFEHRQQCARRQRAFDQCRRIGEATR